MMSRRFSRMRCAVALLAIAGSLLVGCSGANSQVPPDSQRVAGAADPGHIELTGAGATLPYPLYARWFSEYARKTGVQINYQPIGSGGGVKQYTEKTVDFGASDAPLSDDELAKAPGTLHIPMVLGGVVLSYHLDGAPNLKLTPDVLAGIFLGQIRQWNDPRLTALNPGAQLPDTPITVVHRTDGSGTTAVFTDYLAKVSPQW